MRPRFPRDSAMVRRKQNEEKKEKEKEKKTYFCTKESDDSKGRNLTGGENIRDKQNEQQNRNL